jgi:hypothetical protein
MPAARFGPRLETVLGAPGIPTVVNPYGDILREYVGDILSTGTWTSTSRTTAAARSSGADKGRPSFSLL